MKKSLIIASLAFFPLFALAEKSIPTTGPEARKAQQEEIKNRKEAEGHSTVTITPGKSAKTSPASTLKPIIKNGSKPEAKTQSQEGSVKKVIKSPLKIIRWLRSSIFSFI
ncbi:hypothetical protein KW791_00935 [Candidatus Parcubacteria bacterium]|nr:hypothetical protein [Candidatus Parcubacteria bacterium]